MANGPRRRGRHSLPFCDGSYIHQDHLAKIRFECVLDGKMMFWAGIEDCFFGTIDECVRYLREATRIRTQRRPGLSVDTIRSVVDALAKLSHSDPVVREQALKVLHEHSIATEDDDGGRRDAPLHRAPRRFDAYT